MRFVLPSHLSFTSSSIKWIVRYSSANCLECLWYLRWTTLFKPEAYKLLLLLNYLFNPENWPNSPSPSLSPSAPLPPPISLSHVDVRMLVWNQKCCSYASIWTGPCQFSHKSRSMMADCKPGLFDFHSNDLYHQVLLCKIVSFVLLVCCVLKMQTGTQLLRRCRAMEEDRRGW